MHPVLAETGIDAFCQLLETRCGLAYTRDKQYLFEARLRDLAQEVGAIDYAGLCGHWNRDPAFKRRLIDALVTNETYFFRDEATFEALPGLLADGPAPAGRPLVIWSLGCSTGQEAASILIRLEEAGHPPERVQLTGFDISRPVLERAREGRYSALELRRGMSPERQARCFEPEGEGGRLREPYRRAMRFERLNLLEAWPSGPSPDVIFCRNVLIYFADETKKRLFEQIHAHLGEAGLLVLGNTENALAHAHLFVPSAPRGVSAFRKLPLEGGGELRVPRA